MDLPDWPLRNYLPSNANRYCYQLWEKYRFQLKITAPRKTKLGDYRFRPDQKIHLITINADLNPYAFLVVYMHEVAHYLAFIKHGADTKPHGCHWQLEMRNLLKPLVNGAVFPNEIKQAILSYLRAPKATSCAHPELTRTLRLYDAVSDSKALEQLAEGAEFTFRNRRYRKLTTRRTRVTCLEIKSNRTWLIPKLALVKSEL